VSAELLQRAAEKLRKLAEIATHPPWDVADDVDGMIVAPPTGYGALQVADRLAPEDADYIATMHPGVGLALADWLTSIGDAVLRLTTEGFRVSEDGSLSEDARHAFRIARTILGDEA
jgi:hypothetical protein